MGILQIIKKSIVELPKAIGGISDTLNITDKIKNAPSINLVEKIAVVPVGSVVAVEDEEAENLDEGWEETENPFLPEQKSMATFKTGTSHVNYTISAAYGFAQIKLETTSVNIGNAFTLNSDGTFTVNKDCTVKMNCNVMTYANSCPIITIKKNGTSTSIVDSYSNSANTGRWLTLVISPTLVEVKKGESFFIGVSSEVTGTVQVANKGFTYITIEEV